MEADAIRPEFVGQEWDRLQSLREGQLLRELKGFYRKQPVVGAYVHAFLEDHGLHALHFGTDIALAIEGVYRRALGRPPCGVSEADMERAADDTTQRFSEVVDVEPDLALRRTLFQRDLAAPAVVVELLKRVMEAAQDDAALDAASGALFLTTFGLAKAYERAHGLADAAVGQSSIGEAMEAAIGRPLPKVGRNDPCPCGSGKKFKKCCAQIAPPPPPSRSHGEELFTQYIQALNNVWAALHDTSRDPDARWLKQRLEEWDERFHPGDPDGIPDSMYLSHMLFDVIIPRCGKTFGRMFLQREGHHLDAAAQKRLRHLCNSYTAFYELLELRPADGTKRVREIGSGVESAVFDVDDEHAQEGEPGELWLCRLVGPPDDAVTYMSPLIYPAHMRDDLETLVAAFTAEERAAGLPPPEALRQGMKRAGEALAEFVIATAPDDDEGEEEPEDDE